MSETTDSADLVQRLSTAIVSGNASVRVAVQQGYAAGLPTAAFRSALIDGERAIGVDGAGQRPDATVRAVADRLSAALDAMVVTGPEGTDGATPKAGRVAVAEFPGDGHGAGRQLWRALLKLQGHEVHDLGLRAPAIVAREVATLRPDALALSFFDKQSRARVEVLVANLLRRGAQIPLLIGGRGVDEAFAQWLAIAESSGPYWGGVYYCSDGLEMLQVLQQIVLFEPPPQAHSHEHDVHSPAEEACDSCDSCGGCPLIAACDHPTA